MQLTALDDNLIDLLPAAVYVCEAPSGAIRRFNRRAADLWGREPVPGSSDERFCGALRLFLPDGSPLAHADTPGAVVLRTGVPVRDVEAALERPDGSRLSVLLNVEPIRDAGGTILGSVTVVQDITARKQAEEATRRLLEEQSARAAREETERRHAESALRYIAANARCVLWHADVEDRGGQFCHWTAHLADEEAARRFMPLETPPGVTYLQAWYRAVLPDDRLHRDTQVNRAVRAGESYRCLFRCRQADGAVRWLQEDVEVETLAPNRWRAVGICTDVTEQRESEESLRASQERLEESEARLRFALEAGQVGCWDWDIQAGQVVWSANLEELHGLPPGSFPGTFEGFTKLVHPEDRERVAEAIRRTVELGEEYNLEFRTLPPDRSPLWIATRARLMSHPDGQPWRLIGISRDISRQKRAEETLRFLDRASQILQSSLDLETTLRSLVRLGIPYLADYCILYQGGEETPIRQVAEAHADPGQEALVRRLGELYRPDPANPHSNVAQVLRTGESRVLNEPLPDPEAITDDPDVLEVYRRLAPVSAMLVPIVHGGRVLGSISFVATESRRRYDETDLAAAEGLARRAALAMDNARLYGALQEADRRKDEFLAMLSHELRNPLAPIVNAAQLLRLRGGLDPFLARQQEIIERQSRHLSRLVDDLLEVSRITRDKVALREETTDLVQVVQQAVQAVRPYIDARGHQLHLSLGTASIPLHADPTRLVQVVVNLLNNAARYTEPGGIIELAVEVEGDSGSDPESVVSTAVVRVRDNGRGIRPELLPRIFDAFVQDDRTLARTEGGLGIGLTLVKRLVEMHGGSVAARSGGPGSGSEFEIRLPLREDEGGRMKDEGVASGEPHPPSVRPHPSPLRVLVVEDGADARETLEELLGLWGFEARGASSGPEALREVPAFRPDVVLLDIGLPEMDGYEVAGRLAVDSELDGAVLIALTGYGDAEHRRRAAEAGFRHHLTKPVDAEALRDLLRSLAA